MVSWRLIPEAEDAAMSDAVVEELARLRNTVETLTQGLRMMVETQGTHTEMLRAILEAATEEAGESPLPALLTQIVERLDEQNDILHRIEAAASGSKEDEAEDEDEDEDRAGRRPGSATRQ
jgi:predicted transcriptional regulator